MTDVDNAPVPDIRPRLRGVIHRYAAIGFATAFVAVIIAAPDNAARVWVGVYAICVTAMFAVSAAYHSGRPSPEVQRVLKRVDHSTILLAIGGSYTGLTGLALTGSDRTTVLVLVWLAAVIGIGIRMFWLDAPYPLVAVVYVAVGWIALVEFGAYVDALSGMEMALLVLGGVVYTIGGVVYALHRPDLWPTIFGYHELFHSLVTLAAAFHVVAVVSLLAGR